MSEPTVRLVDAERLFSTEWPERIVLRVTGNACDQLVTPIDSN